MPEANHVQSRSSGSVARRTARATSPGPEQRALDVFTGKWINAGETVPSPGAPAAPILTSDVYE